MGHQRFYVVEPDVAIRFTALRGGLDGYEGQVNRLLKFTELKAMHWVNIDYERVTLSTIT